MTRIVVLKDVQPLILRKQDMKGDVAAVCRCGLSMQWPMCDGTHREAAKEEAGTTYQYTRTEGVLQRSVAQGDFSKADPRPTLGAEEGPRKTAVQESAKEAEGEAT